MCLYFRMLLYPCIEEELGQARSLVNVMRRRQAIFFGQKGRFRTSYHYGKARGKTRHGNAERKMMDSVASWMNIEKTMSVILSTRDRGIWKDIVVKDMGQDI